MFKVPSVDTFLLVQKQENEFPRVNVKKEITNNSYLNFMYTTSTLSVLLGGYIHGNKDAFFSGRSLSKCRSSADIRWLWIKAWHLSNLRISVNRA